ncbi:adenylate cyclase [Strigomonas culicis]|nr:adenylate cyclase [Strigomonas culicis]|eukprot:EPY35646.1 adenylate cyclase [Strigomonas culicis]
MVDRFGQQLYDQLLTKNPRLRVYFYGVDLDEQSKTIVRMLGTAVHSYNNPVRTVEFITRAGARHRGYGVTPSVFREMEVAFFKVFPKFVGLDVFEASEEYWKDFWAVVLDLLSRGCESKEGDSYGQMYEIRNAEQIQSDFRIIMDRQSKCDTRHQFVGIMYAKAIEMFGDFSKFDALKDLRAANSVFGSFCQIFMNMLDKEKVAEYMCDLGARHLLYNVSYDNFVSFTEPFLFACRHFMEDEWNVAMESRFLWAFRFIVDGVGPGMQNIYHNNDAISTESTEQSGNSTFCLIFTDIEGSSKLWQKNPQAMGIAVKQHNRLIRSLIKKYEAYEVKTVGDSFIIAAKDIFVGVKIALAIQLELMRMAPIAPHFEMLENTEGRGDASCWDSRTLRVSIGLEHCTEATATYDTVHERYDYYGPSVNRCARIESAACGGQILLSRQSFEALKAIPDFRSEVCDPYFRGLEILTTSPIHDNLGLNHFVSVSDAGVVSLKGIGHSVQLVSMVPSCLSGRQFIDKTSLTEKD